MYHRAFFPLSIISLDFTFHRLYVFFTRDLRDYFICIFSLDKTRSANLNVCLRSKLFRHFDI